MNKITKKPSANGLISLRPVHLQISKLANLLIFSRPTHLLIFTLANLLIIFACSKRDDNPTPSAVKPLERLNSWEHKPVVDTTQIYMPFLTKSEGNITLTVTANGSAWVDTNNNGVFDEGTDVKVTEPAQTVTFTAPNKVFTVYGEVTELNAAGNALTAADAGTNPALTKLNVANNQFTADALTKFIESLPPAPDAKAVLYAEGDSNEVTPEVRKALVAKGWKPMHLNKEGVEEEDKDDPNSYYIELTTKIPLGNTIQLGIDAAEEDKKDIWIDLDGNGVKDDADAVPTKFYEVQPYTLKAEKIRIYGKVGFLNCSDSALTTLDFTKNQALGTLFAYNNPELVIKGNKLRVLGLSVATFHNNRNTLNLSELLTLYIDPSEGVTTVNTAGLAKLQLLNLINCYDITSLALSTNTELTVLNINNSGLTSLDLTKQPKLTELQIAGTPLTELTVVEGASLNYVNVEAYGGKGIKKEVLSQLIGKLPTWKPDNKGKIFIREGQLTNEEKKTLTDKQWKITETPGEPQKPDEPQKPEEDQTPPTLGTIKVTNKTHNQVTVQWDAATDDVTPQEALRYQLLLYKADGTTLVNDYGIINGFSYTLSGLKPNTTYVVKVQVTDLSGKSNFYKLQVTTEDNPEPYIQLATKIPLGSTIQLYINAIAEYRNGVWIDLNGNEIKDDGEAVTIFDNYQNYTLKAQTFRIYGKVDYLSCSNSQLTTLDFTKNEALRVLYAYDNPELVVKGTKLEVLGLDVAVFHKNKNNLDLSILYNLTVNPTEGVTTVHTTGLDKLQYLSVSGCNNITSLDLSTNTALTTLKANNSGLTSLDLTKQDKLTTLEVGGTPLTELNLNNCKELKSLNVKDCFSLKSLKAENTQLTTLDITTLPSFENLSVAGSPLTEINTLPSIYLKVVDIRLDKNGKGLKGNDLDNFISNLPSRRRLKDGYITLSKEQYDLLPNNGNDLKKKGWNPTVK